MLHHDARTTRVVFFSGDKPEEHTGIALAIPFLGLVSFVGAGTIAAGALIASLLVLATVIAAGWYPSVLATRIRPAEALRDE